MGVEVEVAAVGRVMGTVVRGGRAESVAEGAIVGTRRESKLSSDGRFGRPVCGRCVVVCVGGGEVRFAARVAGFWVSECSR